MDVVSAAHASGARGERLSRRAVSALPGVERGRDPGPRARRPSRRHGPHDGPQGGLDGVHTDREAFAHGQAAHPVVGGADARRTAWGGRRHRVGEHRECLTAEIRFAAAGAGLPFLDVASAGERHDSADIAGGELDEAEARFRCAEAGHQDEEGAAGPREAAARPGRAA
ncbi:MAG TPA: hypothetical protein VD813_08485 [Pseudonocardia sp.]|nr:hypothetical protein [Pseudonocardia sp.]